MAFAFSAQDAASLSRSFGARFNLHDNNPDNDLVAVGFDAILFKRAQAANFNLTHVPPPKVGQLKTYTLSEDHRQVLLNQYADNVRLAQERFPALKRSNLTPMQKVAASVLMGDGHLAQDLSDGVLNASPFVREQQKATASNAPAQTVLTTSSNLLPEQQWMREKGLANAQSALKGWMDDTARLGPAPALKQAAVIIDKPLLFANPSYVGPSKVVATWGNMTFKVRADDQCDPVQMQRFIQETLQALADSKSGIYTLMWWTSLDRPLEVVMDSSLSSMDAAFHKQQMDILSKRLEAVTIEGSKTELAIEDIEVRLQNARQQRQKSLISTLEAQQSTLQAKYDRLETQFEALKIAYQKQDNLYRAALLGSHHDPSNNTLVWHYREAFIFENADGSRGTLTPVQVFLHEMCHALKIKNPRYYTQQFLMDENRLGRRYDTDRNGVSDFTEYDALAKKYFSYETNDPELIWRYEEERNALFFERAFGIEAKGSAFIGRMSYNSKYIGSQYVTSPL
jgi:hypothetical protein